MKAHLINEIHQDFLKEYLIDQRESWPDDPYNPLDPYGPFEPINPWKKRPIPDRFHV